MKRRGFALNELLVVVAGIGILAALSIPALEAAKQKSVTVKCLSNLRALCLGMAMYEADYSDYLPTRQLGPAWDGYGEDPLNGYRIGNDTLTGVAAAGYDFIPAKVMPGCNPHGGWVVTKIFQYVPVPPMYNCETCEKPLLRQESPCGARYSFDAKTTYSPTSVVFPDANLDLKSSDFPQPDKTFIMQHMPSSAMVASGGYMNRNSRSLEPGHWTGYHNMAEAEICYMCTGPGVAKREALGAEVITMADLHAEILKWTEARAINCNEEVGYMVHEDTGGCAAGVGGQGITSWCGTQKCYGCPPDGRPEDCP